MGRRFSPLSERIMAFEAVKRLLDEGERSPAAIRRKIEALGVRPPARETIRRWLKGEGSPTTSVNVFVPKPSVELSFSIGAWLGDGWADESDGGKRLRLKVRSESFALEFANAGSKVLKKQLPYKTWTTHDERGPWFNAKVTSHQLYDYVNGGFDSLKPIITPFPNGFLRGFITAEGNPTVSIFRRRGPGLAVGVEYYNTDLEIMKFTRGILVSMGFESPRLRLVAPVGTRTNLSTATKDGWLMTLFKACDCRRFATSIGFADEQKQRKLEDAIGLINDYGPGVAAKKWLVSYRIVGRKWVRRTDLPGTSGPFTSSS